MLPPALAGFLLINPRSGKGRPTVDELAAAARERGIEVHVLREGDEPAALMRTRASATPSASPAATGRWRLSLRSRSSASCRLSVSRSGRGTILRVTSGSTVRIR